MRRRSSRRTASSTTRATWRWCAPASAGPGRAGLGDADPGDAGERRGRPLSPAFSADAPWRRRAAHDRSHRSCATTPPDRGRSWRRRWSRRSATRLGRGEQAMLFLNRRGYAPLTLCRPCGHRLQCPNCTAWLVEHRLGAAGTAIIAAIRADPRCARTAARQQPSPLRPRRRADGRGGHGAVPRGPRLVIASDTMTGPRSRGRCVARDRRARGRSADRHPDRRQGPSLPAC